MRIRQLLTTAVLLMSLTAIQAADGTQQRALWASLCGVSNAVMGTANQTTLNKVLVSWRMLPGDDNNQGYDIWRKTGEDGSYVKLNDLAIISATCWQDATLTDFTKDVTYKLTLTGNETAIATHTITKEQLSGKLPYITIPLKSTEDVCDIDTVRYQANDVSVGDLDGDGQPEIIVKRLQSIMKKDASGNVTNDTWSTGTGAGYTHPATLHAVIWDAYKLDGTFLWRVKGGPQVILGNSSCFAVADFDGDGYAEMAIRTGEGTEFGDGTQIGDTNGDGKIDYRVWDHFTGFSGNDKEDNDDGDDNTTSGGGWSEHYSSAGPEFLSVIDGRTGKELARTNYIDRGVSSDWGDGYWKRGNSFRVGVAHFEGLTTTPSIFIGRGVYKRSVLEGWKYSNGTLTRLFHFDTSDTENNNNYDGQPNSAYAGQGNHSFNIADLNGDGVDDVMYGSMALSGDGRGLWTSGLGHGDANHVGKFLPDRDGLQVFHCLEGGTTMVALHDGKTGDIIWKKESDTKNDTGRCMAADIDPNSPGFEFWWGQNAHSYAGEDLGYKPSSCNAGIWFDGSLSRQLIDGGTISSKPNGRVFTIYRYDMSFNNGTKSNPCWYGDLLGDWREEVIAPDKTKVDNLKIFSTWYPTEYKFPWLMTDHTYEMSALNENAGYNQPTNTGYYLPDYPQATYHTVTIDVSGKGTVVADKRQADADQTVTLTVTPTIGFKLTALRVEPTTDDDSDVPILGAPRRAPSFEEVTLVKVDDTHYTFTMPAYDVTVTAIFQLDESMAKPLFIKKEWTVFCSPETYAVPEGVKAYTISAVTAPTSKADGTVTLLEQTVIAKDVPMVLKNEDYATNDYFALVTAEKTIPESDRCSEFKGSSSATTEIDATKSNYVLKNGVFIPTTATQIGQYSCYIELQEASSSKAPRINMSKRSLGSTIVMPDYSADRQQEKLDHGLTAIKTGQTTYVCWRYLPVDEGKKYVLYRNGQKLVETRKTSHEVPVTDGDGDSYRLQVVDANGTVTETTQAVVPADGHREIVLTPPDSKNDNTIGSYSPNDISVGDIDGDGEYELFVKWNPDGNAKGSYAAHDNSEKGTTASTYIDCYKLTGHRLWSVNLGRNIRSGAHYTQFMVYDFDGDGKAEMICKTAPGSIDGLGQYVSEAADDPNIRETDNSASYRNSNGHILEGPEFLTVFNGESGEAIHTVWYKPNRAGSTADEEGEFPTGFWGDDYGNRSERYLACVAYLDGLKPSAVFVRGYYDKAYFWAVDYRNRKLAHRWLHASVSANTVEHYDAQWTKTTQTYSQNTSGLATSYTAYGNGNHNISVGDYDGDGRDEITFGSAAIDDDGQLMYSVGFGHGDAIHVSDLIPSRPGLEVLHVHEEKAVSYGWDVHDARTGEVIWKATGSKDNGRGLAADLMGSNPGFEFYSANDHTTRSATTNEALYAQSGSMNFRLYWDGSLQDNLGDGGYDSNKAEYTNGYTISRWGDNQYETVQVLDGYSNNSTKATPCLSADILGDWREEVIVRRGDTLLIYTSTMPTDYRVPCLMTDHIYRMGIAWQNVGYNQPAHLGYYLPEAATTVYTGDMEDAVFYTSDELTNYQPEAEPVSITWVMNSGSIDEQATYSGDMAGCFEGSQIKVGKNILAGGTATAAGYTQTLFQQTTEGATTASDDNAIDFTVTLNGDAVFIPTGVELTANRYATTYPRLAIGWLNDNGIATTLASAVRLDASTETLSSPHSFDIEDAATCHYSTGIRLNYYAVNKLDAKQIGLCHVVLKGLLKRLKTAIPTGIVEVSHQRQDTPDSYYDLQGRRIDRQSARKGIYIYKGKKMVIR